MPVGGSASRALLHRKRDISEGVSGQYLSAPYENYDVIIGYRADDSYFSFASAFLNNTISLAQLERAMFLGKLGEQVVLKSERAFSQLHFEESISAETPFTRRNAAARCRRLQKQME